MVSLMEVDILIKWECKSNLPESQQRALKLNQRKTATLFHHKMKRSSSTTTQELTVEWTHQIKESLTKPTLSPKKIVADLASNNDITFNQIHQKKNGRLKETSDYSPMPNFSILKYLYNYKTILI